ncbi:hypothetical protein mRhiFer1_009341 [Rhinolophus ferrumequinum]|uniref:Uncharacterized protein n=1 Tax=Rhinolophus ferrumequinum TaxID=59479 RepID=A0A7J7RXY7_RHIFE|nr:hypothetical protein mRhiFer1_009341 [Rhinolophus ferrumequinum]
MQVWGCADLLRLPEGTDFIWSNRPRKALLCQEAASVCIHKLRWRSSSAGSAFRNCSFSSVEKLRVGGCHEYPFLSCSGPFIPWDTAPRVLGLFNAGLKQLDAHQATAARLTTLAPSLASHPPQSFSSLLASNQSLQLLVTIKSYR